MTRLIIIIMALLITAGVNGQHLDGKLTIENANGTFQLI